MESAFKIIRTTHSLSENGNVFFSSQNPKSYLCYKITCNNVNNPELIEARLWDYLPDFEDKTEVIQLQLNETISANGVLLPFSLIIANFKTPVYATKYSLQITSNIRYRLEGMGKTCLQRKILKVLSFRS